MKQNDLTDVTYKLAPQNYENIFNVYEMLDSDDQVKYMYNILRKVNFPDDLDPSIYTTYVTKLNDTWPLISWIQYSNVTLWWLICHLNNIANPTVQPEPGTELKILDINVLKNVLNSLKE